MGRARTPLVRGLFAAFVLVAAGIATSAAWADAWSGNKGKIYVSDSEYVGGYASDAAMVAGMKKQSKTTFKGEGGAWNLSYMVFLREPAGGNTINIVPYHHVATGEDVTVWEWDAGDTSVGALFRTGTSELVAVISDLSIEACSLFVPR